MDFLNDTQLTNLLYIHCLKCRYVKAAKEIALSVCDEFPSDLLWLSSILILPDSEDVEIFHYFLNAYETMRAESWSSELNEAISAFVDSAKRLVLHLMLEQNAETSELIASIYRYFPKHGPFMRASPLGSIGIDTSEDKNRPVRHQILAICLYPKRRAAYLEHVWSPNKYAARAKFEDRAKVVSKALASSIFDMMFFESDELCEHFQRQGSGFSQHIACSLRGKQWLYEEDVVSILQYLPLVLPSCSQD